MAQNEEMTAFLGSAEDAQRKSSSDFLRTLGGIRHASHQHSAESQRRLWSAHPNVSPKRSSGILRADAAAQWPTPDLDVTERQNFYR